MCKVYGFFGADHKVGTTMMAQSAAELLAEESGDGDVLFLMLNESGGTEYVREEPAYLDPLKSKLESRMMDVSDFYRSCRKCGKLYLLGGVENQHEYRHYMPEDAAHLVGMARTLFKTVMIDCGNRLDDGMSVGALSAADSQILVLTQGEIVIQRWERKRGLYNKLGILPDLYLLNSYLSQDTYNKAYIQERLGIPSSQLHTVGRSDRGWRAEKESRTFAAFEDDGTRAEIIEVLSAITGEVFGKERRRGFWKRFT